MPSGSGRSVRTASAVAAAAESRSPATRTSNPHPRPSARCGGPQNRGRRDGRRPMAQQRWTEKLAGHETMRQLTTTGGVAWCVSGDGRKAWPLLGPATQFGPYDIDSARARGEEVDIAIPPTDYRVR